MTPKEQYEARKAERKARRENSPGRNYREPDRDEAIEELFDRFVTAVERIAEALERPPPVDFDEPPQ